MKAFVFAACACVASFSAMAQPQGPVGGIVTTLESRRVVQERFELQRREIVRRLPFFGSGEPSACVVPPPTADTDIDVHRSLFVHDRPTLEAKDFSLTRTFGQLASQVLAQAPGTTAASIFRQFWDTQNTAPGTSPGPHCNDNGGTVNGFPNSCRTAGEGQEALGTDAQVAARMAQYRVVSLVNRIDLAHEGWRNCGEYRIIYGRPESGIQRNLIIFEAVLPNPKPGCREGCLEVAKFWKSLSAIADPAVRAAELEKFFYGVGGGLPGFRPVVHVDHYSATGVTGGYGASGSGQIRTNQFIQQPWVLKELKTVLDCGATPCKFQIVPIMVKVNPFGDLWNEDTANNAGPMQARASAFQADLLLNVDKLAAGKLTDIGYSVALDHDAAQSFSQAPAGSVDNYREKFHAATGAVNTFRGNLAAAAGAHGLTADQIVNRALAQSCAGCHKPSPGLNTFNLTTANSIGPVLLPDGSPDNKWPDALSFVHVDTPITPRPEVGGVQGHALSPALNDVFLPARKQFLLTQLNAAECACRSRFPFLTPERAKRALAAQNRVERQFGQRVLDLQRDLQAARTATAPTLNDRTALQTRIRSLHQERERSLVAQLKKEGIALPSTSLRAQALKLRAFAGAKGNAQRERDLRQTEVINIVRGEPPRRTVTGSFAVH